MKPLRRIIFHSITLLSLLLLGVTAGSWVRSYWARDILEWYRGDHQSWTSRHFNPVIGAEKGSVMLGVVTTTNASRTLLWLSYEARKPYIDWCIDKSGVGESSRQWRWCAFGYAMYSDPNRRYEYSYRSIFFPHWFAILGTAVAPALWLRRRLRCHQAATGARVCSVCSYDLRATPERCPECGKIPASAKA